MRTVRSKSDLLKALSPAWAAGEPIALVPTMGFFHAGHLRLMREAKKSRALVVVSLFVNPTQFGAGEDLDRYPRNEARDAELAAGEGVDILFAPGVDEMYSRGPTTWVEVPGLSGCLCGRTRPGHFRGVATVVAKLLNLVRPAVAFFGAKDFQQTVIIKRMVADLDFPVEVRTVPTVREEDGLAMSSRNGYLSPEERRAASLIPQAMDVGRRAWSAGATPEKTRQAVGAVLARSPLLRVDYVAVVHPETLEERMDSGGPALLALAVYAGATRLIDNLLLP